MYAITPEKAGQSEKIEVTLDRCERVDLVVQRYWVRGAVGIDDHSLGMGDGSRARG